MVQPYVRARHGGLCPRSRRALIRKSVLALVLLLACGVAGISSAQRCPPASCPMRTRATFYVNMQLPNAASLERTSEAAREVEKILADTPGVQYTTSVVGFSLLSFVRTSYNAFFFVTLKPWDERTKRRAEQFQAIKAHLNQELSRLPEGTVFSFSPPAIPGVGTSGGFQFVLEDRAGKDVQFLADNLAKFMAAARKRPEIGMISTTFLPSVPQEFVDVDRDKGAEARRGHQRCLPHHPGIHGRAVRQLLQRVRPHVAGVCGGGSALPRRTLDNVGQFYVRNNQGEMVPLSALTKFESRSGPEFTMRYNEYRSAQINGSAAPGYSSDQATAALEDVFKQTMPREMGFDYMGMSFQEQKAREGVPVFGDLRLLAAVRVSDSGGAL